MMTKNRGFEVVSTYVEKEIELPKRATEKAAGYDFKAAEDTVIPSIWKTLFTEDGTLNQTMLTKEDKTLLTSTLVPTGIKAYMGEQEYLQLANRSSNPIKNQLTMPNGVGIIDSDYYNNESNEGHIYFQFINYSLNDHTVKKGERIGQGIFVPFLKVDNEEKTSTKRVGGFGSSGK